MLVFVEKEFCFFFTFDPAALMDSEIVASPLKPILCSFTPYI